MEKRYQVFVSSTYVDLREERQKVVQTLMEMDCIPAVMEVFPAADEQQWEFIKKIIDDCDYYILIIGGRYGSLTSEGVSYTEKEFDYALSREIPVLVFVHADPAAIALGKSDIEPQFREKLEAFRMKATTGRLVKQWSSAAELAGLVSLSLNKTIKTHPAIGWARATHANSSETLMQLSQTQTRLESALREAAALQQEVSVLRDQANRSTRSDNGGAELAALSDPFSFFVEVTSKYRSSFEISMSWADIFAAVAPRLQEHPNELVVRFALGQAAFHCSKNAKLDSGESAKVSITDIETIRVQLQALGLIQVKYAQTTMKSMALFWNLTPKGLATMVDLRSVKSASSAQQLPSAPSSSHGEQH